MHGGVVMTLALSNAPSALASYRSNGPGYLHSGQLACKLAPRRSFMKADSSFYRRESGKTPQIENFLNRLER